MESRHVPSDHIRRLLECSICFEQFRKPKELDCQHTFCESPCLEKLVNEDIRQLQCPLCRFEQAVPDEGVGALKTNRIVKDLIDLCKDQRRGCEVCCSNEITTECLHCAKEVCAECKTRHTTHMLIDVQQLASRIAEEAKIPLVKLETHSYYCDALEISVTGLKAKVNNAIEDIVNQLRQKGRELECDLDLHLTCELSKLECLEEKCLKWSNILETCWEAKTILSDNISQETMNAIRKILHAEFRVMPITIDMPQLLTVQIQLRKVSVLDNTELFGTLTSEISLNEQPPLKSHAVLPRCDTTWQREGAPEINNDPGAVSIPQKIIRETLETIDAHGAVSNSKITIQGSPETSDATCAASSPDITIQGTPETSDAPGAISNHNITNRVKPETDDVPVAVSSPDMTIHGTPNTNDVYCSVSSPMRTIRGTATHQFFSITALAISPVNGDIAVCDTGRHIIALFTAAGRFIGEIGGFGHKPGSMNKPRGVTYNPEGQLVIADTLNHRIQIFDEARHLKRTFSNKGSRGYNFCAPSDVASSENTIWACDQGNNRIWKFSKNSGRSSGNSITSQRFQNPTRIIHDPIYGGVYVLDTNGIHYFVSVDGEEEGRFRRLAAGDLGEHLNMSGDSAVAMSEDGHLVYSTTPNSLAIYNPDVILIKSFLSNEAMATNAAITSVAIAHGCVAVAGSKYLEIY